MSRRLFAALTLVVLAAAPARADMLTGTITGVFASSGTNVYSANGVTIVFTGLGPGVINTPTFASFGNFDVTAAPLPPVAVADTFTLTVGESAPDVDAVAFTATLGGLLGTDMSSAFFQFAAPLTQNLDAGAPTVHVVSILSADQGVAGRVNLGVPSFPNASVTGSIVTVPEPASAALLGLGTAGLAALLRRRD